VRNYVRASQSEIEGTATIQGNDGGCQNLCLLGGDLLAGRSVDAASIGTRAGPVTRVITGVSPALEAKVRRYQKGLEFCTHRLRRTRQCLGNIVTKSQQEALDALKTMPADQHRFVMARMKELGSQSKLKESLVHYLKEFEDEKLANAGRAFVRVTGVSFPKTAIQIGESYRHLEEEISEAAFRLKEGRVTVDLLNRQAPSEPADETTPDGN
jgi:uncharacterized protein (DUF342 family)